jgi:protein involved in polysaccharide export with SLBB domain
MSIYARKQRVPQALCGALTALLAAALLSGFGGSTTRAFAQNGDNKANQAPAQENKGPLTIGDSSFDPNQPIKPDFVVSVSVVGEPDPSGTYKVDQAGNVSIKYAGIMTPVSVKGLTPGQAADAIAKFLKTYIKNPQVTVSIVEIPRPIVFVSGAVKNTGPIIVTPDTTLVDVLSKAEWNPETADLTLVRITRREVVDGVEKTVSKTYNFDRYIKSTAGEGVDEANNPVLHDKDRIFVPYKTTPGSGVVSVLGEVTKPTVSIPLRSSPPMTVREVINVVGGTTLNADRRSISIRRAGIDRPLIVDLDKAEQGDLVNNIELRPDDAVYVEKLDTNAYINVDGGFVKTGKFVYDRRTTLTQAIMEAGGPALYAKENQGTIFRHPDGDPKNTRVIPFNWNEIKQGKTPDIALLPGDSIWMTPGSPPTKPPLDVFGVLSGLTSVAYIYNTLAQTRYYTH